MLFGNTSTGDMSLGMTGMGTVSVMNNLAVMGNSLTVNGKEVATEEYVDNKVSEAMAYQTSVSSISNDNASNDENVSAEQPIRAASNQPSNAITLDPNDSNLSKKDQIKEEVIKSNKDTERHRTYDGGGVATMVDNTDISDEGTAIDVSVSSTKDKEWTYIGTPTVASNSHNDTGSYSYESSAYLQEQVMNIERNTAKLTEHSALIQGNTMSILSNTSLIQETRDELYGGLAMSAALSTPELFRQKGLNVTAGSGYYGGRAAMSFSANYVTDRVMYSIGYAHAHGAEKMARAGVSFHFGGTRR
jgi:hypothetical protein